MFKVRHVLFAVVLGVGYLMLRKWLAGGVCHSKAKLTGKTVIVTGSNTGVGKETAKDLAQRGAKVILACRDILKGERAAEDIIKQTGNDQVYVRQLDLANLRSVRRFAEEIIERESHLDILINNAGIMACPHWKTDDGFEMQFGVNHLGHFLLTNLLLDLIKKSAPARIVVLSSLAHTEGTINFDDINSEIDYDPWASYAQSKLANVLFTRELSKRLEGSHITVNSVHPGVISSELFRHFGTTMPKLQSLLTKGLSPFFFKTPQEGAQTTICVAVDENLVNTTGLYFSDCVPKDPAPQAKDDEAAKRLWDLSAKMVGLEE